MNPPMTIKDFNPIGASDIAIAGVRHIKSRFETWPDLDPGTRMNGIAMGGLAWQYNALMLEAPSGTNRSILKCASRHLKEPSFPEASLERGTRAIAPPQSIDADAGGYVELCHLLPGCKISVVADALTLAFDAGLVHALRECSISLGSGAPLVPDDLMQAADAALMAACHYFTAVLVRAPKRFSAELVLGDQHIAPKGAAVLQLGELIKPMVAFERAWLGRCVDRPFWPKDLLKPWRLGDEMKDMLSPARKNSLAFHWCLRMRVDAGAVKRACDALASVWESSPYQALVAVKVRQ